jgi:hypothetical protein
MGFVGRRVSASRAIRMKAVTPMGIAPVRA